MRRSRHHAPEWAPLPRAREADEARRFALELAGVIPSTLISVMNQGVVLEPGEAAFREHRLWLAHQMGNEWSSPISVRVLLTDRRLLVTTSRRETQSLWWGSLVGFHVNLERCACVLDYGDGHARLLTGPDASSLAVLGVAMLYGVQALVLHSAIAPLRASLATAQTC